ncbi:hypothetical protein [Streptomyces sp. NBC_01244]|uniref:hypothetical protein n=1 Tax=Streptomyces sp. NBC_01244 TaxID=2903797 RepID=UPI002E15030C|nr:hypothetical protein OG247_00045 [Streptomyces sp. NBC_01244]
MPKNASGAKASRLQLDLVMQPLREGDTLKVTRLDRLSSSNRLADAMAYGHPGQAATIPNLAGYQAAPHPWLSPQLTGDDEQVWPFSRI